MNATGSVLVDTNVVVAYFRGEKALAPRFLEAATLYLPWVVLGELHYGASRSQRREAQIERIRDFLRTAVLLLPDQATAEHYGQLKAELAQVGKPIPDNDLWIAALARQHDLPLATGISNLSFSAEETARILYSPGATPVNWYFPPASPVAVVSGHNAFTFGSGHRASTTRAWLTGRSRSVTAPVTKAGLSSSTISRECDGALPSSSKVSHAKLPRTGLPL